MFIISPFLTCLDNSKDKIPDIASSLNNISPLLSKPLTLALHLILIPCKDLTFSFTLIGVSPGFKSVIL